MIPTSCLGKIIVFMANIMLYYETQWSGVYLSVFLYVCLSVCLRLRPWLLALMNYRPILGNTIL